VNYILERLGKTNPNEVNEINDGDLIKKSNIKLKIIIRLHNSGTEILMSDNLAMGFFPRKKYVLDLFSVRMNGLNWI